MKKARLLVLMVFGALVMSIVGVVYVQAGDGPAAIDPLYPVVGATVGTRIPTMTAPRRQISMGTILQGIPTMFRLSLSLTGRR